jgi:molecular chaperone GrpE
MSQKKKIKINIDAEEPAENENTEKPAPTDANPSKSETGNAENSLKEMEAKFEAKEEEAKETYDRLLRVSADFENYKKTIDT